MAFLFDKFKQNALGAGLDLDTADIRVILIDEGVDTPVASDEFLSSITAGARVHVSGALQNTSITDGIFDADNIVLSSVTGNESEGLLVYYHTGVDATARLIAYFASGDVTGLPVTPNGGDININWDDGANKIFAL